MIIIMKLDIIHETDAIEKIQNCFVTKIKLSFSNSVTKYCNHLSTFVFTYVNKLMQFIFKS